MTEQADKAFQEMLDISTDIDKAVLFKGNEIIVTNFPESVRQDMVGKALELSGLGDQRAKDMGSSPLTQLMVETGAGSVFLVREAQGDGMGVLATGKKDSRVGLVFYDMKTCMRDAQEEEPEATLDSEAGQGEAVTE
jgi:predicted regulator of Ras-like GTPase activity (Roadblock/LC7/MglB family)